jgi:hypothetical protein
MSYNKLVNRDGMDKISYLKSSKVEAFNKKVHQLRHVMKLIGKRSIQLNTSEAISGDHLMLMPERKYSITVEQNRVSYLTSGNNIPVKNIDDEFLMKVNWFQLYVYVVEMELELTKISNHIQDSMTVSLDLNDYIVE